MESFIYHHVDSNNIHSKKILYSFYRDIYRDILIKTNPNMTCEELSLNINKTVSRNLKLLKSKGYIHRIGSKKRLLANLKIIS